MATVVATVALLLGVAAASDARQRAGVTIAFAGGRVSLVADRVPASDVLAEWSRIGKTEIIGGEGAGTRLVSVKLDDVSEAEALDAILGPTFGYVTVLRSAEPGLSSVKRLVLGESAPPEEEPVDPSAPPEARYSYYVPDKALSGENYGTPEYVKLKELPPAPETRFDYYTPEKATSDVGTPVYEKLDEQWVIPEKRFKYFVGSKVHPY